MRSDAVKSTHLTSTGLNNNSTLIFYMEFPHRLRSVMIGVMHVHPTRTSIILRHECQVPLGLRRTRSNLPIWNDSKMSSFSLTSNSDKITTGSILQWNHASSSEGTNKSGFGESKGYQYMGVHLPYHIRFAASAFVTVHVSSRQASPGLPYL